MNYNLTTHGDRRVFIIPITSHKKKKWWQFWKKDNSVDETQKLKEYMKSLHKDYWFPSPNWGVSRKVKIEKIRNKIDINYHSLYK